MTKDDVIAYLNEEIQNLTRTRDWLSGSGSHDGIVPDTQLEPDQPEPTRRRGKRKGISAAGRRKLSEAMRARWAARRAGASQPGPGAGKPDRPGKRNVSAAARAKMAAAQKRRWAAFRKKKTGK